MKTVLFVTFHFPPSDITAARRTGGLAKYLPKYGWRVVVLTPRQASSVSGPFELLVTDYEDRVRRWRQWLHLHDGDSLSMPQKATAPLSMGRKLRKRVVMSVRDLMVYPDASWSWYRPAVRTGKRFLAENGADVILSSYGPATCHIVASALASGSHTPWVADYRDPWGSSPYTHSRMLRAVDKRLEDHVTGSAAAFIGVSKALTEGIGRDHLGVRTFLIPNGYDPEDRATTAKPLDPQFTIVHCGYLYEAKRDPRILFEAVGQLIDEGSMLREDVRIHFYGPPEPNVDRLSHQYRLDGVVFQHGIVSRDEAIAAERSAQVLLVVLWSCPEDVGTMPAKVFEYLAAQRPIIAVGTARGELSELLNLTGAGAQAASVNEMRELIRRAYREYLECGYVRFSCDDKAVEELSQVRMARQVAEVLDYACNRRHEHDRGLSPAVRGRSMSARRADQDIDDVIEAVLDTVEEHKR